MTPLKMGKTKILIFYSLSPEQLVVADQIEFDHYYCLEESWSTPAIPQEDLCHF